MALYNDHHAGSGCVTLNMSAALKHGGAMLLLEVSSDNKIAVTIMPDVHV